MRASPVGGKYDEAIDRESAFEVLKTRAKEIARREEASRSERQREEPATRKKTRARRSNRQTVSEAAIKSAARTLSSGLAREILRGVLGGLRRR